MVFNKFSNRHLVLLVKCGFNLGKLSLERKREAHKEMFYCSVLWQFFRVVAHNAEQCATLLPTTAIIFPRCGQQHGKVL